MFKYGEVNPLNVHGLRELKHCPPHFAKVNFELKAYDLKRITNWVYENLAGRFYAGDSYQVENNRTSICKCVAFEDPAESTYFSLFLDKINSRR